MTLLGPVFTALALGGGLLLPGSAPAAVLHYHGATVTIPAGWPVYNLASHPSLCVRFDRRAVYLGRPGSEQQCVATPAGRPRAILVEPRGHGAVVVRRAADTVGVGGRQPVARLEAARTAGSRAAAPGAVDTGPGFDPCATPSSGTMTRWLASPYRAVGVYIGGTNMACSQPNLDAPWVSAQSAAGWHLIDIYVGLQAPSNSCRCAGINPQQSAAQGRAAADDAVTRAGGLGIGPGNPIYFDMEAYSRTATNTNAVMSFLAAWTKRLHALGYKSAIYSSSGSGISDLVARYGTSYSEPDEVWFAEWNGSHSTSSSYIPAGDWSGHRRLHQYDGGHNETWRGATLNIDGDAVDAATAAAGRTKHLADGTFVALTSTGQVFRIAGDAPLYVSDPATVGNPRTFKRLSPTQFATLATAPTDGTFLQTASGSLYRVAGGAPFAITQASLFPTARPVKIDPWVLDHLGSALAHLNATPLDGTVIEGLPSHQYWIFAGGKRTRTTAALAVQVDDEGLGAYRMRGCLVPNLQHRTLNQVRSILGQTNCVLGQVTKPPYPTAGHRLRVVSQSPAPRARRPPLTAVAVTVR